MVTKDKRWIAFLAGLMVVELIATVLLLFSVEQYVLRLEYYALALLGLCIALSLMMVDHCKRAMQMVLAFFGLSVLNSLYLATRVPQEQLLLFVMFVVAILGLFLTLPRKRSCVCPTSSNVEVYPTTETYKVAPPAAMDEKYVSIEDLKRELPPSVEVKGISKAVKKSAKKKTARKKRK